MHSFAVQRHPEWQLVVVDDRSTDDIGVVLERYRGAVPSITWIKIDKSVAPIPIPENGMGVATSMNIGVRHSRHDCIIRIDPETMQITKTLWKAGELDLASTWYVPVYDIGPDHQNQIEANWEVWKDDPSSIPAKAVPPIENPLKTFWYFQAVWSREKFLSIGGIDEQFNAGAACEDDDFANRMHKIAPPKHPDNGMLALHQYHGPRLWWGTPEHRTNYLYLTDANRPRPLVVNEGINSDSCIREIVEL